jgi:hypothetical protein
MATINKPQQVGLSDPNTLRRTEAQLAQAAIIANGKSTVSDGEAIFVSTTAKATAGGVTLTTSANNQPSDIVTVYSSQGNTYVSAIDQTIKQTVVNQVGVSSIIAGNNITITSTGTNGTGAVTINSTGGGGNANTGNITFDGDNIGSTNDVVNIIGNNYAQLQSGDSYIWVESNYANIEVNGNTWSFDAGGILTAPGNIVIDNGGADGNIDSSGNINVISNNNTSTFDTTGNLTVSGSGYFQGQNLYVGEGANSLTQFGASTLVISANDTAYIQAVVTNVSDIGSADWVAYGHHGSDVGGWVDTGFTSASYSDANFTITGPGTGYVFAQGYDPSQGSPSYGDGSLVLATGNLGNVKDIIFATGGFSLSNEFMRINNSSQTLQFYSYGNVTGANVISANSFVGNGSQLTNVATTVNGSWTLAAGTNTVSLSVPLNGTYSIWVRGNIPNGIVTYTATAVVTNTNVPVLGSSYGWYYATGNALVLTAIPTQFVGTLNNISNAVVTTTTANVFTFGITNNSGASQTVNWGYTKL